VQGHSPFPQRDHVVPASDGAGVVEAVGSKVHRFKTGDKVITLFNQGHLSGSIDNYSITTGTGGVVDGTLQQYGSYNEEGLVALPSNLNFIEGATLTCAGLTAWNALFGLKPLLPGDWVLTQGTGGVSIFALQVCRVLLAPSFPSCSPCWLTLPPRYQFAKATGAKVIATTSSQEKADRLKSLGADHVLNYKEDENWGETAKKLAGDRGVQHIVEVGGPNTMAQSLKAIGFDGIISVIGFLGGFSGEKQPSMLDTLTNICTVRGVYVGSRLQFEQMNRAIEANDIKPVIDSKVFTLDEVKEAYQYQWDQKHFSKICIQVEEEAKQDAKL
jgi:NADPH:quinone reductase-like Zn-dependent oxidoreductase